MRRQARSRREETERLAILYYTVFTLCSYSLSKSLPIYARVCRERNWQAISAEECHALTDEVGRVSKKIKADFDLLHPDDLVVQRGSYLYPKRLMGIDDGPEFLFLRGDIRILDEPVVSVVGTRNPSAEGQETATELAKRLTEWQIMVASGLACGMDRAAHEGALMVGNKTVAVIGTPLNKCYPRDHAHLQKTIAKTGLVVSQFMPGISVMK